MNELIFERYVDECGNISVRVSQDVTVLTREEAERAMAKYDQLRTENQRLRELVRDYERCTMHADCSRCEYDGKLSTHCPLSPCFPDIDELRELGVTS